MHRSIQLFEFRDQEVGMVTSIWQTQCKTPAKKAPPPRHPPPPSPSSCRRNSNIFGTREGRERAHYTTATGWLIVYVPSSFQSIALSTTTCIQDRVEGKRFRKHVSVPFLYFCQMLFSVGSTTLGVHICHADSLFRIYNMIQDIPFFVTITERPNGGGIMDTQMAKYTS